MVNKLQSALLLALAVGLCLNSSAMAMRVCTMTLDTCCESHVDPSEAESDCCGEENTGCCLTVLSDETAMVVPAVETLGDPIVSDLTYAVEIMASAVREQHVFRHVPDPPPPSSRERLSKLEIRLI